MVSVGDVVYPTDTSLITCAAKQWLVIFVFSLDLTPLTVKVYAIDTLIQQEKKRDKPSYQKKRLFGNFGVVILLIVIYLYVWTLLEPLYLNKHMVLTDHETESGSA